MFTTDSDADYPKTKNSIPIFELWIEHEKIAMHFNDLLIKLRVQALAGVTAIGTIASIFAKTQSGTAADTWELAAGIFAALCMIWIAIFILDFFYYYRLLQGAVRAIIELEEMSKASKTVDEIRLSGHVEDSVKNNSARRMSFCERVWIMKGVLVFYLLVFITLFSALAFALSKICNV